MSSQKLSREYNNVPNGEIFEVLNRRYRRCYEGGG